MKTYLLILYLLVFQPSKADRKGGTLIRETDSDPWKEFNEILRSSSDNPNLREGDIFVLRDDRQAVIEAPCHQRWPRNISFAFHSSFNMSKKFEVYEALAEWEDSTCLSFFDITSEPTAQKNESHIIIRSDDTGCWSSVGMHCSHSQNLNLQDPGCVEASIVLHEIGHALGLEHEHTRTDRDKYVRVIYDNVKPNETFQFEIATNSTNFDLRYDYESIMHYPGHFFAIDPLILTMETLNPLDQFRIGKATHLSHKDKAIVNLMYGCGSGCTGDCLNGGFFMENCTCICPPNYNGPTCANKFKEDYEPKYDSCGPQTITSNTTIKTLNWPGHHYLEKCMWHLKPPQNKRAKITFDAFNLVNETVLEHVLVLLDGYNGGEKQYSGTELQGESRTSVDDKGMVIVWDSLVEGSTGFKATVKMIDASSSRKRKKCKKGKKGAQCRKRFKFFKKYNKKYNWC